MLFLVNNRWVFPLFLKGNRKNLEYEDLYKCPKNDDSKLLSQKLFREWAKQLAKKKSSLSVAIIKTFGLEFIKLSLIGIFEEWILRTSQPIFLGIVIRYFNDRSSMDPIFAYLSAAGLCLCSAIYVTTHNPYFACCARLGMRVRVACTALIYEKILKLNNTALSKTTLGQIINLLSNDASKFDEAVIFFAYIFLAPVQICIVLAILWNYLGATSLIGVAVLVFFIPFQAMMGKFFSSLRAKTAAYTDERIRLMNEIISSMKVIKMYAWEKAFANLIAKIRKSEISKIGKALVLKAVNMSLALVLPKTILFICFVTFVFLDGRLNSETVFVTVALFNVLRLTMTFFGFGISYIAESLVSCQRIQKFLLLEERKTPKRAQNVTCNNLDNENDSLAIVLKNYTGWWHEDSEEPCLKNLQINLKRGKLLAVIGTVGSGKSSFLMALLDELSNYKGSKFVNGKVAYTSQEPWSFNDSIRNNILFGRPYEEEKYEKVMSVTALERDLKLLSFGDETMVGEKGVSLSGGQKARISLARAIYSNADIFLLDDPLSAVDASVAKHIFEKCIMEYLSAKTRILVTHQIQFVKKADQILVLNDGKPIGYGTYEELIETGMDFFKFTQSEKPVKEQNIEQKIQQEDFKIRRRPSRTLSLTDSEINELEFDQIDYEYKPKVDEEIKQTGSVDAKVYLEYIKSGTGVFFALLVLLSIVVAQSLFHSVDLWLTKWTNYQDARYQSNHTKVQNSSHYQVLNVNTGNSGVDHWRENKKYIIIYFVLIISLFLSMLFRATSFFLVCMRASVKLHNKIFYQVLRSPMALFNNNPIGRILNRFSRDLGIVDEMLPTTAFDLNLTLANALGIVIVVAIINPYLLIPAVILNIIVINLRNIYINTARDIKRFEGLTRSPIYSHISTTVSGLPTLRSFAVEDMFQKQFHRYLNDHSGTWFLFIFSSRALSVVMDWICIIYLICITTVFMAFSKDMPGGDVGLALSSALMLIGMFQWGVRQSAEFESQMTSVERIIEYTKLPSEADLESSSDNKPPPDWPTKGEITFQSTYLYYEKSPKPVLCDLNFTIRGGEKIGIVGRTGAGKSSLLSCLFRMSEPEGSIIIDGINIQNIGLHDLRKKISIIPQDPVLFAGTVRNNIDPFNEKEDADLWRVLEEVQLKDAVLELNGQLDALISEGGSNFSVGQRQLICLARALLRNNKILVIDEATANVDLKTDYLIQAKIRENFKHCTVLTIAHRLNTIIDSDRVLVLDAGQVVEFDAPFILLKEKSNLFSKLVRKTGSQMYEKLYSQAMHHYYFKQNADQNNLQSITEEQEETSQL